MKTNMDAIIEPYIDKLFCALRGAHVQDSIHALANELGAVGASGRSIYLCGNGGSAGNAIHLANDLLYGAGKTNGVGLSVEALSANGAVMTCLGNDLGYENIFSEQIRVKGRAGDLLVVLSGSGNSPNIAKAITTAKAVGVNTWAILGFDGGICKTLANNVIHFEVHDMQVAEDLQLIVGHLCMQWLSTQTFDRTKDI